MSLINRMLQDLDARRAAGDRAALPNEVRVLPPERPARAGRIAAVLLAGAVLAAGLFWLRQGDVDVPDIVPLPKPAPLSAPAASPPAAASLLTAPPATAASEAPAADPPPRPEPPEAASQAVPAPSAAARDGIGADRETALRIETALKTRPAPADKAGEPAKTPSRPPRSEEAPPSIEKQMRATPPRERSENDFRRAVGLMNQGRIGDAIAALRSVVEQDGAHLAARTTLAGLLVEQKRLDEAQSVLAEGLVLAPGQAQLALRLARIHAERGDLRAAAETLQIAAANGAGNAEFHGVHAAILQRLGRHKEAAEEYQAALRGAPQSGVWWMGLGISLESEGRPAEAREAFNRARATGALSAELDRFVEQRLRQIQ